MKSSEIPRDAQPIGYKKIVESFAIETVPHFCWSYISPQYEKRQSRFVNENTTVHFYPNSNFLFSSVFDHLEFALKYEGLNLYILKKVLEKISLSKMTDYLLRSTTSAQARILWYLYEEFNGLKLPLPDLEHMEEVFLLDSQLYYCGKPKSSPRHRVSNNLLGTLEFCPMVRKAPLEKYEKISFEQIIQKLTKNYKPFLFLRAARYLYAQETLSLVAKKTETPAKSKLTKFVEMVNELDPTRILSEELLAALHSRFLETKTTSHFYRDSQNYVQEREGSRVLCYIAPVAKDVPYFMKNLLNLFETMKEMEINPIITTALLSFGFIYIHPFNDGNGRIHRFLMHYAFARLGVVPKGGMLPLSVSIVQDPEPYERALKVFSKPLLELIKDYSFDKKNGKMEVFQETTDFYRFIDFTPIIEYFFSSIYQVMTTEFEKELILLSRYDKKLWDLDSVKLFCS